MKIVARTLYGLEDVLADELVTLGAERVKAGNRAVTCEGTKGLLYRLNYNCRTALSFLVPVTEFSIAGPKDLYNGVIRADWDRFLDPKRTFAVSAVVTSKHFDHSGYAALVVKDAIADFFRRLASGRPNVDARSPDLLVNLHISHEKVTVSLDSSLIPLFKRGYRQGQSEAPLNEVLAAGIIMLSGWKADSVLTDGMCGSGTIPAEAGLMACRIAPGKFRREFGFMRWKDFDDALFRSVKYDAAKRERPSPVKIFGSDISGDAAEVAAANIEAAGLKGTVHIACTDFLSASPPADSGTLIINPPYGHRIGGEQLPELYKGIGSCLKHKYSGFKAWILSGDLESLKSVALKPFKKYDLYNGNIKCALHGYDLFQGTWKGKVTHSQ